LVTPADLAQLQGTDLDASVRFSDWRGPARSQREKQLRFESNVGEFIGYEHAAQQPQAPAPRGGFQCSIEYNPDQLGADEYMQVQLKTREPSHTTKHPIGPVAALERDMIILHEGPKQRCVTLLLANE